MENLGSINELFENETGLVASDANSDEYVSWLKKKVEMLYNLVNMQNYTIEKLSEEKVEYITGTTIPEEG